MKDKRGGCVPVHPWFEYQHRVASAGEVHHSRLDGGRRTARDLGDIVAYVGQIPLQAMNSQGDKASTKRGVRRVTGLQPFFETCERWRVGEVLYNTTPTTALLIETLLVTHQ
jgi:hypothetical protein